MQHRGFIRICVSAAALALVCGSGGAVLGEGQPAAGVPSSPGPTLHRTRHFVVVSETDSHSLPVAGALLETIHSRLSRAMASYGLELEARTEPLVWRCFDDRGQYRRYAQAVEPAGALFPEAYYSTRSNHVVVLCDATTPLGVPAAPDAAMHLAARELGSAVARSGWPAASIDRILLLTHEMAHQLAYNSGLQKRGVMYPLWVSEGLATFFECSALPKAERAARASRQRRLAQLGWQGRLLGLHELVALAGPEALESSAADVYAQCWGLLAFLLERHPGELSVYLSDLAHSPLGWRSSASLRRDFVRHFGPLDALDRHWRQFVASLPASRPIPERRRAAAADTGL